MATEYTIYLVNNSANTEVFWCFLARPAELASDAEVYANSSTNLAVAPMSPATNTFTIPVQYVVGAGASNSAVGLDTRIDSSITQNTDLGKLWDATYATVPPNLGPTLKAAGAAPDGKISLRSNSFNQGTNEANGWFSNMSYGIKTKQGFVGMSWSPAPQKTRTLTPKLEFFIATGTYGSNELASWTDVSNNCQVVTLADFKYNKATVTYTEIGGWIVTPGAPPSKALRAAGDSSLLRSHRMLAEAHARLVSLSAAAGEASGAISHAAERALDRAMDGAMDDDDQRDAVVSVAWDAAAVQADGDNTWLTGTLTVQTALTAAFAAFVLSGVRFAISSTSRDGLSVRFSYSGTDSANFIKSLFTAGAQLLFEGRRALR